MKHASVLFAYAWIGTFFLVELLAYPAADAMTFTRWLTDNPSAFLLVAGVFASLRFLVVGALYHWLRGEEEGWARDAAVAWAATLLLDVVFVAFETRFTTFGLWRVVSVFQALNLAVCLLGAWLADENAWRPGLREARQWLLDTASWAR